MSDLHPDEFVVFCIGRGREEHAPEKVYAWPINKVTGRMKSWPSKPAARADAPNFERAAGRLSATELHCGECKTTKRVTDEHLRQWVATQCSAGAFAAELSGICG